MASKPYDNFPQSQSLPQSGRKTGALEVCKSFSDYLNPSHKVVTNLEPYMVFKPFVSNSNPSRVVANLEPLMVSKPFVANPQNHQSINQSLNMFQSFPCSFFSIRIDRLVIPNQLSEGEADDFA